MFFSFAAAAAEWPRFRGVNGEGHAPAGRFPAKWSEKDYRWRTALAGAGNSSPVVSGERVVVTSADPTTALLHVECFHTKTGQRRWHAELPSDTHRMHARNSYASSTPAIDDARVYVTFGSPRRYSVVALDLADGRVAWRVELGPFSAQHGFGASPILYRESLVVPNDQDGESFLVALRAANGHELWRTPRKGGRASYSAPCVYDQPGRAAELIFTSCPDGMSGIDPATGRQNWTLDVFPLRTVNSPVVAGDLVLASCGEGGGGRSIVAVRPGKRPSAPATLQYEITEGAPYVTTPIVHDGLLFLWHDRGTASCHELATGKRLWNKRLGGNFSGSPVLVGGRMYCIAESGDVVVLAAEREFKQLGRNPLGQSSRATPAVAAGQMYLRTESTLFCLGEADSSPR